jgi:hypothetical protein
MHSPAVSRRPGTPAPPADVDALESSVGVAVPRSFVVHERSAAPMASAVVMALRRLTARRVR